MIKKGKDYKLTEDEATLSWLTDGQIMLTDFEEDAYGGLQINFDYDKVYNRQKLKELHPNFTTKEINYSLKKLHEKFLIYEV